MSLFCPFFLITLNIFIKVSRHDMWGVNNSLILANIRLEKLKRKAHFLLLWNVNFPHLLYELQWFQILMYDLRHWIIWLWFICKNQGDKWSENHSVMSDSLWPHGLYSHGILQAKILEWVAFPFSRGSSQSRDQTQVSCITGDSLPTEPPGKPWKKKKQNKKTIS